MTTEQKKEVAITKIVVQLGKKELIFDIEDAKQLKQILNELFAGEAATPIIEKTIIREEHHHYERHPQPYYWGYLNPSYISSSGTGFKYDNNTVYCSAGSSG